MSFFTRNSNKPQVPKNANPPAPPHAGPKLASAVFRDCEIRGRKTIEARFDNGDTMQFIRETPASPTWVTYPMMVTLDPKMVNKLNDIERYLKTWGGPYPTAHESQVKPKGVARVGEEGQELMVQPDGKMKLTPTPEEAVRLKKGWDDHMKQSASHPGATVRDLPKGTSVMPHAETLSALKVADCHKPEHYAGGK